jgi:hypothetical protein
MSVMAELAANEQDPQKLMALIEEIDCLIAEKLNRLDRLLPLPDRSK